MNSTDNRPCNCRTLDCLAGRRTLHLHECGHGGCLPQYLSIDTSSFSDIFFTFKWQTRTYFRRFRRIIYLTFINDLSTTRVCGSSPANVFDPGTPSSVLSFFAFWPTRSFQPRTSSRTFRSGRTWSRLDGTRLSCIT